jgi:hypothetical protein
VLRDAPRQVGVGEEVLTERFAGTDPVPFCDRLQRAAAERRAVTS